MPNRQHMRTSESSSADTLDSTHRMIGYLQSNLPWSTYLETLPPIARRHYLNMPPNLSDIHVEITQPSLQFPAAQRPNLSSLGGYHTATTSSTSTAHKAPVPNASSSNTSSLGGYSSATTAAKRSHTDTTLEDNDHNPAKSGTVARRKRKPTPSKRHRTRSNTKTGQPQDSPEPNFPSLPIGNNPPSRPSLEIEPFQHLTPQEVELARTQLQARIQQ